MPLPTSYDEGGLAAFIHDQASPFAEIFEWEVAKRSYDEIINDVLISYGVTDIADATDIPKLRALTRYQLFKAAQKAATIEINYKADGASFNREAIFDHISSLLANARVDAYLYLPETSSYSVDVLPVTYEDAYSTKIDGSLL